MSFPLLSIPRFPCGTVRPKESLGLVILSHCQPVGASGRLFSGKSLLLLAKEGGALCSLSFLGTKARCWGLTDGRPFQPGCGGPGGLTPGRLFSPARTSLGSGWSRPRPQRAEQLVVVRSLRPPFLKLISAAKHLDSNLNQWRHRRPQPPSSLCGFFLRCGALD